jgi:hypothetical protein
MRISLLLLLLVISIPLVLRRPLLGISIYLGLNIIRPEMLFWGQARGSYVFKTYYFLLIIGCLINGYLSKTGKVLKREFLLMVWLFLAIVVSIYFTQYQPIQQDYFAIEFLKDLGILAMLYLVVDNFEDVRRIQYVLMGCFAFLGVWGIEQSFRGNDRLEGLGGNSWGDSNGVAAIFALFLPVALSAAYTNKKRLWRLVSLGITAVIIATIICTQSRAGLLGIVVSLSAFAFYSRKSHKLIPLFLIVALLTIPFLSQQYIARMQTMGVSGTDDLDGSARSRIILWEAGLMVFADNPIVGTGFLTYPEAKMKYENRFYHLADEFREMVFRKTSKKVTHNTYIQILSDCGLLGMIPFVLLVLGGIGNGFSARRLLAKASSESRNKILLLCGISAGITGYAICIITIDSLLDCLLYVQLIIAAIIHRMLIRDTANAAIQEKNIENLSEPSPVIGVS